MHIFDEITSRDSKESDLKRDNANVDGDSAMGTMLQYGATAAKEYNEKFLLRPEQARAYREGWIHIHDFDFYALTMTCCQIDLLKLFHGGFSTGHGFLRAPFRSRRRSLARPAYREPAPPPQEAAPPSHPWAISGQAAQVRHGAP